MASEIKAGRKAKMVTIAWSHFERMQSELLALRNKNCALRESLLDVQELTSLNGLRERCPTLKLLAEALIDRIGDIDDRCHKALKEARGE